MKLHRFVSLQGGYSKIWGGAAYEGFSHDNGDWAYAQVEIKY